MAIRINVRNLNKRIRIDLKAAERIARTVLKKEYKKKALNLGITFVDDAMMKRLNYRFRKRRRTTDVLSFWYGNDAADIIISSGQARVNAERFNTGFKKELALYVIHGILHLAGFDDNTGENRAIMERKEKKVLERIWRDAHLLTA